MKKILPIALSALFLIPSLSYSSDYMNGKQWQAQFCGKTNDGENHKSGWTFKVYVNQSCDKVTVKYLTGDKAGKTFERKLTVRDDGLACSFSDGKKKCGFYKNGKNGTILRYIPKKNKLIVTSTNFVDGNRL